MKAYSCLRGSLILALLLIPAAALADQSEDLAKQLANPIASLSGGVRYWLDSPDGVGPEGWGFKLGVTLLFPR